MEICVNWDFSTVSNQSIHPSTAALRFGTNVGGSGLAAAGDRPCVGCRSPRAWL